MAAVAAGAAVDAGVQHQLGDRAPAGDPARRRARRARPGRPQPRVLHQRRLGVGRGGVEDRPPALPGQGRAAAHEGDRARDRLPRRHARRALFHRRAADEGAVRRVADPGRARRQHERVPARRSPTIPAAHLPQLLQEMERAIVETGPETVAMIIAEPVQNAGGCLVPPDGYWPGLRELADQLRDRARRRRGHHRLRPHRRVVRVRALRHRPRRHHAAPRASRPPTRRWAPSLV